MPKINVPISRKAVAAFVGAAVAAGLNAIGVYDVPADVQGLISAAVALGSAYAVADGAKYANALAAKYRLPVNVSDEDVAGQGDSTAS